MQGDLDQQARNQAALAAQARARQVAGGIAQASACRRRLLVSLPHHGKWWEPARAVQRGAAHGSGRRDAFSTSRSAGQPGSRVIRYHSGRGIKDPHPIALLRFLVEEQFVPAFVAAVAVVSC